MSIPKTPDKYLKSLGIRLKKSRENKFGNHRGSMKRCSEVIGISAQTWNDYESGKTEVGFGKLLYFGDFFGVDPAWLLTGREELAPEWMKKKG